tara:strand:- start:11623 stop:12738 length:1116 start_codon:yes stop_codon:yes gene_type:complete
MAQNNVRFILTADDYGPIDFVNKGIIHHVREGNINSVHVFSNFDRSKLKDSLNALYDAVPGGKQLDLGIHLSLVSGSPLYQAPGKSIAETWGEFVKADNHGKYIFKGVKYFNVQYLKLSGTPGHPDYLAALDGEFDAQIKQLVDTTNEVNAGREAKLKVTCISNHQNILTISEDLFERHIAAVNRSGHDLAYRPPKVVPNWKGWLYYKLVVAAQMKKDSKALRQKMRQMFDAFQNNQYTGTKTIRMKSPSYIDIRFYSSLGSAANKNPKAKNIPGQVIKFTNFRKHAFNGYDKVANDPAGPVKVEMVFHLGDGPMPSQQSLEQTYPGVTRKYFDNREVEFKALERIKSRRKNKEVFDNLTSWSNCGIVTYS